MKTINSLPFSRVKVNKIYFPKKNFVFYLVKANYFKHS